MARVKNSQQQKKLIRNLPQIPTLKMSHLSPTNAANPSLVTPTTNNIRPGGIQSLTIETAGQLQHQAPLLTGTGTTTTSPTNATNN